MRILEVPLEIKKPFTVVSQKLIIEKNERTVKLNWPVIVVEAKLFQMDLFYRSDKDKVKIGDIETTLVTFISPIDRMEKHGWIFDSVIEAQAEEFTCSANMVNKRVFLTQVF